MSLTFKVNDKFRVKENDLTGVIKGVSFNSIHQEWEYYVIWDHQWQHKNEYCYTASEADNLWEKISEIAAGGAGQAYVNQDPDLLPKGYAGIDFAFIPKEDKKQCQHKWVEVGFHHTKTVCYHCDMEKP